MAEPYIVIPFSPLRKVIAARMAEAKRTIPHFRVVANIEVDGLLSQRQLINLDRPQQKVSVNDCLIKGCAVALMEHPALNIQLHGEEIHQYCQADISVVVAIAGGLAAPIVRAADRKTVREIAKETDALVARAAAGQLRMSEIVGGTFSISNLGVYGVDQFDAIINPPQCAILAVGSAKPCLAVDSTRQPRVATVLRAALSVDHRAIDGVTAAAFMATLRRILQEPQSLFA